MMEYTEEVETVLPEGYSISSPKKEPKKEEASFHQGPNASSSSSTTVKKTVTPRKKSMLSRGSPGRSVRSRSTQGSVSSRSSQKSVLSRSGKGISKKFSKLRVSLEKAKESIPPMPKPTTPRTPKKKLSSAPSSSDSSVPQKQTPKKQTPKKQTPQKQTTTSTAKIVKQDDRRDTEEAPTTTSSHPVREESPTATADCSLTDESAESRTKTPVIVEDVSDDDESTVCDTTSVYGRITGVKNSRKNVTKEVKEEKTVAPIETSTSSIYDMITGVLSPSKSNIGEEKVEEVPSPMESLMNATSALVRGQSGVSVSTTKNESVSPTKERANDEGAIVASGHDEIIAQQASIEIVQEQDTDVAKVEEGPTAGLTWAKNISLKVGGFETSFQIADPVATITGKVNEVMDGFDSELVKQAEALEYAEAEVDYEEKPTKLFLLLQQKAWGLALNQLEKHPEEAEVWVHRKFVAEKAPNVHDASDPEKSQALVKQETALSTIVNEPAKYRWRLLPLHASIVLGAPQEVTSKILLAYPEAARKVDERGSLPVHLAASRLDVDEEGEKTVLQLFGVYADSIDITDRNGRTAPELAKLARARKAAEKQRLMETASRGTRLSRACVETSASVNGREEEEEEKEANGEGDDGDDSSVKSSFSTRFRNMMKGSKSMDDDEEKKKSKGGDLTTAKSFGDDDSIVADVEGMAPGFSFLEAAKVTDEREAETIAEKVNKVESDEILFISAEYQTPAEDLNKVPADALQLPLPRSASFGDGSVKSAKSSKSAKSKSSTSSQNSVVTVKNDEATVVSTAVESIVASPDPQAALRAVLEKACENAGRPGMDVTKFLVVLEEEWVTDVEAIRRLDGATLDSILPIMLSRELQRLVHHSNTVDGEYLRRSRGRSKKKQSSPKVAKKKKKRSYRKKPASRSTLDPINEEDNNSHSTPTVEEGDDDSAYSAAATEGEKFVDIFDENEVSKNQANLVIEARKQFPTREALEDAINERQATVTLAVGSGFDVDRLTLTQAALADDEVRKLLPLRLILPTAAELQEMHTVLQTHKEDALKEYDVNKALKIQLEMDEIERQIEEEEKYLTKKNKSLTNCIECGTDFETKKKMVGILKKKEMVCDNCRLVSMPVV